MMHFTRGHARTFSYGSCRCPDLPRLPHTRSDQKKCMVVSRNRRMFFVFHFSERIDKKELAGSLGKVGPQLLEIIS